MPGSSPSRDPFDGTAYRRVRTLGAGSVGRVYLVEHRESARRCVAKVLHEELASDARLVDRFRLEAQALGRLRHPNIVSILAVGTTTDARPFLVMEHLRGTTLAEELAQRLAIGSEPLPLLDTIAHGWQLASALAAAHGVGVVHRDIKPANLFLCERADGRRLLKVLDFGVVRVLPGFERAPEPLVEPTEQGLLVGTPAYASPERIGGRPADERTDIYAAGLVLFRMLTGRSPFEGSQPGSEPFHARLHRPAKAPSELSRTPIPAELDRVVLRTLAKDPNERFQSAQELCDALEAIGHDLAGPQGWAETIAFEREEEETAEAEGPSSAGRPGEIDGAGREAGRSTAQARQRRRRTSTLLFGGAALGAVVLVVLLFALG